MDILTIVLLVAAVGLLAFLVVKSSTKPEDNREKEDKFLEQVNALRKENADNLRELRSEVERQLSETRKLQSVSAKELNTRLDKSAEVIGSVQKQLGQVGEATKQMQEIGKDISSLQDILMSPKMRGNFGELLLENLLEQMLPGRFEMQYTFKTGERADAILKLKDGKIVAIDSKFPLEDFQRLVACEDRDEAEKMRKALVKQTEKHVNDVANKYILPSENTLDFAFLYVPAENVYYELTTSEDNILAYAWKKKVFIVSPNSFYAYLVTVLQGLRALEVEKNVQKVLAEIQRLGVEFGKFQEDFGKIGTHLRNASTAYSASEKRAEKLEHNLHDAIDGNIQVAQLDE